MAKWITNRRMGENRRKDWVTTFGGYFVALLYFLGMTSFSIYLHNSFRTHAMDLGYFDQVIWNTSQGRLFANTLKYPYHFLGDHFSPILALLAPLYWVWPDVRMLLLAQSLALALAGLPLYWLARQVVKGLAPLVLVAFYLNPELHLVNLSDFHEIALVTPFVALALYALLQARYPLLLLSLFLALCCKEDMAIVVMSFGLYLVLRKGPGPSGGKGRWWGVASLVLGAVWLAGAVFVAIPHFRQGGGYGSIAARYSYLGNTPQEALTTVLRQPEVLVTHLLQGKKLLAFLRVLLPVAFLPFLGWPIFCLSFPLFVYLQLSDRPSLYTLREWHVAPIIPILLAAAIVGLQRLKDWKVRRLALCSLLLGSLVACGLFSPIGRALETEGMAPERRPYIQNVLKRIPSQAVVSAQTDILPHLSQRQEIYLFPSVIEGADFIVLDREGNTYPVREDYDEIVDQEVLPDPSFQVLYQDHGFLLLEKYEPPLASSPLAVFGGSVALRGVSLASMDAEGFFVEQPGPPTARTRPGDLPTRGLAALAPGDRVQINLYWECLSKMEVDYTVFVHFLADVSGNALMVGQHDGLPALPTSGWKPGDIVKDTHYVQVAAEWSGTGQIQVGLYDWQVGDRLPTVEGRTYYVVTDFTVEANTD